MQRTLAKQRAEAERLIAEVDDYAEGEDGAGSEKTADQLAAALGPREEGGGTTLLIHESCF